MKKILFVCTGNSCRSVMAEGLLKKMLESRGVSDVRVLSAGTHAMNGVGPTPETIQVMSSRGIDVTSHRGQLITPELVTHADAIFCMEGFHRDLVLEMDPRAEGKAFLLRTFGKAAEGQDSDVPDPIGLPLPVYEMCVAAIEEAVQRVADWLVRRCEP